LGIVDNAARHGGNEDDATGLVGGDHVLSDGLGHEEGPIEVDINQAGEFLGVVGLGWHVGTVKGRCQLMFALNLDSRLIGFSLRI
jgi:hypothetical protein